MAGSKHKPPGSRFGSIDRPAVGPLKPRISSYTTVACVVSKEEKAMITRASMKLGKRLSPFLREIVVAEVRRLLKSDDPPA